MRFRSRDVGTRVDDRFAHDALHGDLDAVIQPRRHVEVVAAEIRRAPRRLHGVRVHDDQRKVRRRRRRLVEPGLLLLDVGAGGPLDEREPRRRAERAQHHVAGVAGARTLDELGDRHRRAPRGNDGAHVRQHDAGRIDDGDLAFDRPIPIAEEARPESHGQDAEQRHDEQPDEEPFREHRSDELAPRDLPDLLHAAAFPLADTPADPLSVPAIATNTSSRLRRLSSMRAAGTTPSTERIAAVAFTPSRSATS